MTDISTIKNTLFGIVFVALLAGLAMYLSGFPIFQNLKISQLIIAIVLGMIYGNLFKRGVPEAWKPGITFSTKRILRAAIVLYGFQVTFQQVVAVGVPGIMVDAIMLTSTFILGTFVAIKIIKLDPETAYLTAAGACICGAAAVLATEPVVRSEAYKSAIAVSTVVLFGTISMFLYPTLYRAGFLPDMDLSAYGIYVGATVHEVAQVVAAGVGCSEVSCHASVVVKMGRVMMLVPFLLFLGWFISRNTSKEEGRTPLVIPWFAIGFVVVVGFNSLQWLPADVVGHIRFADSFMLTMAMGALGLSTDFSKFKEVGMKPIYAGLTMFVWLLVGGYFVTQWITGIFGTGLSTFTNGVSFCM